MLLSLMAGTTQGFPVLGPGYARGSVKKGVTVATPVMARVGDASGGGDGGDCGGGVHGVDVSRRRALQGFAVLPVVLAGLGSPPRSEAAVPPGPVPALTRAPAHAGSSSSSSEKTNTPASKSPIVKLEKLAIADGIDLTEAIEKESLKTARRQVKEATPLKIEIRPYDPYY